MYLARGRSDENVSTRKDFTYSRLKKQNLELKGQCHKCKLNDLRGVIDSSFSPEIINWNDNDRERLQVNPPQTKDDPRPDEP